MTSPIIGWPLRLAREPVRLRPTSPRTASRVRRQTLTNPGIWSPIEDDPPYPGKSQVQPAVQQRLSELYERTDLLARIERLGVAAVQADADGLREILIKELPGLFEIFPNGSLWYVSVDQRLLSRLAFMRVRLQLTLTPDIKYDSAAPDNVHYFGMHTTTNGIDFSDTVDHVMLAIPPTALELISEFCRTF